MCIIPKWDFFICAATYHFCAGKPQSNSAAGPNMALHEFAGGTQVRISREAGATVCFNKLALAFVEASHDVTRNGILIRSRPIRVGDVAGGKITSRGQNGGGPSHIRAFDEYIADGAF